MTSKCVKLINSVSHVKCSATCSHKHVTCDNITLRYENDANCIFQLQKSSEIVITI